MAYKYFYREMNEWGKEIVKIISAFVALIITINVLKSYGFIETLSFAEKINIFTVSIGLIIVIIYQEIIYPLVKKE